MNITQKILANPDGGTVKAADPGQTLPTTGYFVGGVVSSLIIDENALIPDQEECIETFVAYLIEYVADADYIGWWTDAETRDLYVDGTTWFADYNEAEQATRDRGEIAFWDIERNREFRPVILKEG
jgi:hypothetical protein